MSTRVAGCFTGGWSSGEILLFLRRGEILDVLLFLFVGDFTGGVEERVASGGGSDPKAITGVGPSAASVGPLGAAPLLPNPAHDNSIDGRILILVPGAASGSTLNLMPTSRTVALGETRSLLVRSHPGHLRCL